MKNNYLFIFFSHITRQAQYNHPCLTSCYLYTTSEPPRALIPGPQFLTNFSPHSALVILIIFFKLNLNVNNLNLFIDTG